MFPNRCICNPQEYYHPLPVETKMFGATFELKAWTAGLFFVAGSHITDFNITMETFSWWRSPNSPVTSERTRKENTRVSSETSFASWGYVLKLPMFWTSSSRLDSYHICFYDLSEKTVQIHQLLQNGIVKLFLSLSGLSMSVVSWRE